MTEQAKPGTIFDVVNVKGFGDLVIALTCLRHVHLSRRQSLRLLVSPHLEPLRAALNPPFAATLLPQSEQGPAVLFKARSTAVGHVARSAIGLRRALTQAHDPAHVLLFDEWDVRHRFLSLGRSARGLPLRDNLYRRWNDFLIEQGLADPMVTPIAAPAGRQVHIFPGAREEERRLPIALLQDLVARASSAGLEARVFVVEGEMPHLGDASLPVQTMPREFSATIAAVSSAHRVVSADSMTAHLAEYLGKPVFVLSPTLKYYWLPLSSALSERHALFADRPDDTNLPAFLHQDEL